MKLRDKIRLSLFEFSYGKAEWIVSIILYTMVFTCILFLGTMGHDMDRVLGGMLSPYADQKFFCQLSGYTASDVKELEKLGLTDFLIQDDGTISGADIHSLNGIWKIKFGALLSHRDIYLSEIESDLMVLLFVKIVMYGLSLALLSLMAGNLSNSYAMKLAHREKYIDMLYSLGMSKRECRGIYARFFGIKNVVSLCLAVGLNALCIRGVNVYARENFKTYETFDGFKLKLVCLIALLCALLAAVALRRKRGRV
ncbi:MAG TPA: hypothetical protein DCX21_02085 [Eubacterium sp.]|nr:hypothetical protein [Eubacterium sp.]HBZ52470.1 hypothetical protein [Eubacterium sp.]